LTLDEDQDDQKIAKWVTVHPPISGQFSPVADSRWSQRWSAGWTTASEAGRDAGSLCQGLPAADRPSHDVF
ncbi:hypothetical protein ACWGQ5_50335, partial [Streptomyces sp. NPDC055722]